LWNKHSAPLFLKKRESKHFFALLSFFSAIFFAVFLWKRRFFPIPEKIA